MIKASEIEAVSKLSYQEIALQLSNCSDFELIELLDAKSIKIKNIAAECLSRKRASAERVIDAILASKIKTKIGRICALHVLSQHGKSLPRAKDAYYQYINDPTKDVVGDALFGLVFFQDTNAIDIIKHAREMCSCGDKRIELYDRALDAIIQQKPEIYAPGFYDMQNVWKLR